MSFRTSFSTSCLALAALASGFLATESAEACGGLFCSNANPVNQAAERIIFASNDDGTVTAAIEIMYEGPSHEFAWVLPVPAGEVEVGVSSKEALDRLNTASNPLYRLNRQFDENCPQPDFATGAPNAAVDDDAPPAEPESPVQVVAEGNTGPYVWQQLMVDPDTANPEDDALTWLQMNGYDVTDIAPELLRGYLEDGQNLLAFKLSKGKEAGSIRPVLLTYESERPIIPIQPTAVAANEDMGVKVWVLGDSRAIPNNYYHLEINQAMINWFNPNSNYNEVIINAANEADEGHGFVTEQAGPAGGFAEIIYSQREMDAWEQLRTGQFDSVQAFLQTAQDMFGEYDGYQDVISNPEIVPLREGATPEQFMACMQCYFEVDVAVRNEAYPETPYDAATDPLNSLDAIAFLDEFHTLVIEPLEKTSQLFKDHASVTRLYTTLSPDEMTLDPEFDFNPDLPDVDNVHQATQVMQCDTDTEWRIELPQGMVIKGNGQDWPVTAEDDFPFNLRIVSLGTSGEGDVITDNSDLIAGLLTDLDIVEALPDSPDIDVTDPDPNDPDADEPDPDPIDTNNDDKDPSDSSDDDVDMGDTDTMAAADSGGCGCAVAPQNSQAGAYSLLALLGLGLMRRRRSS